MPYKGWQTVAIREETYKKLERKAQKENRSVSNMADTIISEAVKE